MKRKKKLLSMFLVFVLCLSMLPTSALAEEAAGNNALAGQEESATQNIMGAVSENGRTGNGTCQHEGTWTDGKCDDCGYECLHEDANVIDGECTVCGMVFAAQNITTGKKYQRLDDAMNEASDGDTVIMLRDTEMKNSAEMYKKTVTLDLNGKNCTSGFIYIGNDDIGKECDGGLNLTGKGNHARIVMRPDSVLNLTGWDGEIEYISCVGNCTIITKNMSGKINRLVSHGVPDDNGIAFDGGSFGMIEFMTSTGGVSSTKAGSLLAAGYAFKNEDGTFVPYDYTLKLQGNKLYNVTVVKCSAHQDKDNNGFCDYCNTAASLFVVSVTTGDGEVRYFTAEEGESGTVIPDAVAYANENNGTIKQISQLSNGGTLSIYGANCTIDLNNQTIGYIAAGGSNLTITGDGTVTLLNTESGSAKLYGGVYNEITLPTSTALRSLLPDGYGFKKTSDDSWITGEELEITGSLALNKTGPVRIEQAPITNLTVDAPDITYCDDLTATATVKTVDGAEAVTYKWYIDGTELTDQTAADLKISDDKYGNAGTHTIRCAATCGNYVASKEITMTVNLADLKDAGLAISGEDGLMYYPVTSDKDSGMELNLVYNLWYKDKRLSEADHTVIGNENVRLAGTYTLTVTGKGNYTGTKSITYKVQQCPIIDLKLGNIEKVYDGTRDVPLSLLDEAYFTPDTGSSDIKMERGIDYTIDAQYDDPEVGDCKTIVVRVNMLNTNFSFENGQREREFVIPWKTGGTRQSIDKAVITPRPAELAVVNGYEKTYTVDLAKLLPELKDSQQYGDITYGTPVVMLNNYYDDNANGAKIENGILSLPIKNVDTDVEDNIGTVSVVVSTKNFEDMVLTINVKSSNKLVPTGAPTLSKAALSYGEKLGDITLSGSMMYENEVVEGTFIWENPDLRPDIGTVNATWIFTPNNKEYAEVKGQITIPVQKAVPQITAMPVVAVRIYNPSIALIDSDLTGGKATDVNGNLLTGTWSWQSAGVVPTVNNKGYTAIFTPDDGTKYEKTTVNVSVNVIKATPVITVKPTAADITSGDILGASVLSGGAAVYSTSDSTAVPGTFKWLNGSLIPSVADSNATKYPVIFVPADTANYEMAQTEVTLNIQNAPATPSVPVNPVSPVKAPASAKKPSGRSLPKAGVWEVVDKETSSDETVADDDQSNTEIVEEDNNTREPFIKNDSSKSGWELIKEQIKNADNGETVSVEMNGTTNVPSDVFEQFKGKDVKLQFDMGDGIVWTINGKDITDIKGDIDLGVIFGTEAGVTIPVDVINNVTGEHYSINLTLAHSGEFGFTATLTVNMKAENAGYYANLFYYNPESNELEFICADQVDKDGNVNLTFTHASDYTIVLADTALNVSGLSETQDDDSAGNTQWILFVGLFIVIIGLGVFFIYKKKSSAGLK